ncbi:hypothetical protein JRI60_48160 [Archangium violaceum]|uniref:hypothetical protein n=1 Tax=Archangium violaceum TaxID=83451 RepID=UPI00194F2369|nr:hypothetical protein [Archangium violaceum]QRN96682.1 hypothetical protein JRI60_48160 [Archangium violaceum]
MHDLMTTRFLHRLLLAMALMGLTWAGEAGATRWGNGLNTWDLRFNALSANPEANARMVQAPLRADIYALWTGDSVLRDQLEDSSARAFMQYVVACALEPSQTLSWTDRAGRYYKWKGELGLCPAWASGAASEQCQRWVSACVLARNNAWGYRVLFSARGDLGYAPAVFTPQPTVNTDAYQRLTHQPVASTLGCGTQQYGVNRACGFQLAKVGRCTVGQRVHLGGGGTPWDYACPGPTLGKMVSGDMVFRVCEGLGACDGSAALAQSEGSCGGILPAVSFTCPASATFSVLTAPYSSTAWGEVDIQAWYATYAAPETSVFPVREGAFWGTIFGPGAVASGVKVYVDGSGITHGKQPPPVPGSIYPRMYACQGPGWSDTQAYATARLCTLPGQNCVAQPLGRCDATLPKNPEVLRCQTNNATGYGDYGQCVGADGMVGSEVITPWLNQPCDVVGEGSACKTLSGVPQ